MGDAEKGIRRRNGLLAALSFIVIALLIWLFSKESNWYESNAANRSTYYARDAERQIADRCALAPARDQAKCIDEAVDTARKHQREEQDLAAQQVTAWWTRIMGGAAITGMVLSALGVYLVWLTFSETRKQARSAEGQLNLALAQSAPDPKVTPHPFFVSMNTTQVVQQYVQFEIRNLGHTEARNVRFTRVAISTADNRFTDLVLRDSEGHANIQDIGHGGAAGFVYTHPDLLFPHDEIRNGAFTGMDVTVAASWSYEDIMGALTEGSATWRGPLHERRNGAGDWECLGADLIRIDQG
jgi:hypothetical protein